jgi:hypothetical protein
MGCNLYFDNGLMTSTFDDYSYVMRYYVYSGAYFCGFYLLFSISYSFRKSSAEVTCL